MDTDFIKVIYDLLPGFFAAWLFYGLTAHPRRAVFERVIQALIFTGIIRVFTNCFGWICLKLGQFIVLGQWTDRVEFGWSMVFAGIFGIAISTLANRDIIHRWLREGKWIKKLKVTKKNSFPSEWFSAFQREDRWTVLQFKDGRRLYGWPEEWPNEPKGHFLMTCPSWVLKNGDKIPMPQIRRIMIEAATVEWVEQLTMEDERTTLTLEQTAEIQQQLIEMNTRKQEKSDNGRAKLTA